jgi:hypothetical protein
MNAQRRRLGAERSVPPAGILLSASLFAADLLPFMPCVCGRKQISNRITARAGTIRPSEAVLSCEIGRLAMALRKFIIERDIPKVGTLEREQLRAAAAKSNEALRQLGSDIQWVESYVADNKTFCVYLAKDEAIIHKHAEISGFPATKVTEVKKMIDPTTAAA